jgi:hypothetical protein
MCFSATASFLAAGIIGATAFAAMTRVTRRSEIALAAMPAFFAVQQSVEGLLWLALAQAPGKPYADTLTLIFLLFAKIFWPVYAPWAPLLIEPDAIRVRWMRLCALIGTAVGAYFLWSLAGYAPMATIAGGHIVYGGEPPVPFAIIAGYFIATCIAAALSSHAALRVFAAIVAIGSVFSYAFYWEAYSSVWCFFAAAASLVVVVHLVQVRNTREPASGTLR